MTQWIDIKGDANRDALDCHAVVICDDPDTGYIWSHLLRKRGMEVFLTDSPKETVKHIETKKPDIVIIDESSRELNSVQLIRDIRSRSAFLIILFSPNWNETYILDAYKAGVDDFATKPVSPAIFLARVQALLRRVTNDPIQREQGLSINGYRLDPTKRELVDQEGNVVKLSRLEFRLLHLLMQNPGWVYKPEDIVTQVWGYGGVGSNQLLKHLIFRLRRKIEADPKNPKLIKTQPGVGYVYETNHRPSID